jgi:hypothetical protein
MKSDLCVGENFMAKIEREIKMPFSARGSECKVSFRYKKATM